MTASEYATGHSKNYLSSLKPAWFNSNLFNCIDQVKWLQVKFQKQILNQSELRSLKKLIILNFFVCKTSLGILDTGLVDSIHNKGIKQNFTKIHRDQNCKQVFWVLD